MNDILIVNENKELHKNAKLIKYYVDKNGCHICISHRVNERGYPVKRFSGKNTLMSRYIWHLNSGTILPSEIFVLHKCDNPACINFEHLFIGSNYDNVQDKVNKNRQAKHSNLNKDEIYEIKINTINTSKELSEIYNVSDTTVRRIWNDEIFKYIKVDNYEEIKRKRKERMKKRKIKNNPNLKGV